MQQQINTKAPLPNMMICIYTKGITLLIYVDGWFTVLLLKAHVQWHVPVNDSLHGRIDSVLLAVLVCPLQDCSSHYFWDLLLQSRHWRYVGWAGYVGWVYATACKDLLQCKNWVCFSMCVCTCVLCRVQMTCACVCVLRTYYAKDDKKVSACVMVHSKLLSVHMLSTARNNSSTRSTRTTLLLFRIYVIYIHMYTTSQIIALMSMV